MKYRCCIINHSGIAQLFDERSFAEKHSMARVSLSSLAVNISELEAYFYLNLSLFGYLYVGPLSTNVLTDRHSNVTWLVIDGDKAKQDYQNICRGESVDHHYPERLNTRTLAQLNALFSARQSSSLTYGHLFSQGVHRVQRPGYDQLDGGCGVSRSLGSTVL